MLTVNPAEKNNRNHYRICNGFNGSNGNSNGFNGHCNGLCWSLLVICFLLLVACIVYWILLRTNRTPLETSGGIYWTPVETIMTPIN